MVFQTWPGPQKTWQDFNHWSSSTLWELWVLYWHPASSPGINGHVVGGFGHILTPYQGRTLPSHSLQVTKGNEERNKLHSSLMADGDPKNSGGPSHLESIPSSQSPLLCWLGFSVVELVIWKYGSVYASWNLEAVSLLSQVVELGAVRCFSLEKGQLEKSLLLFLSSSLHPHIPKLGPVRPKPG
jgi:hypothetical protein